jgi:hypothetical protein
MDGVRRRCKRTSAIQRTASIQNPVPLIFIAYRSLLAFLPLSSVADFDSHKANEKQAHPIKEMYAIHFISNIPSII